MRELAIAVIAIWCAVGTAHANEEPWAVGVGERQKTTAAKLLEEGNKLFLANEYRAALDKYVAAVGAWNHPAIQFNIARCLMKLERHVEAADQLDRALVYGAAPFEPSVYAEALALKDQLARMLGSLTVTCNVGDADVRLDGKSLFDCVGQAQRKVTAGQHQLVARKDGYVPFTHDFVAAAGSTTTVAIRMLSVDEGTVYRRRWSKWRPWTVVATGGAVAIAAIPVQMLAASNMKKFRDGVSDCGVAGCAPDDPVNDLESRALLQNRIAVSMWIAGGAIVSTGLVMVYMNRERRVMATPVVAPGVAGMMISGSL